MPFIQRNKKTSNKKLGFTCVPDETDLQNCHEICNFFLAVLYKGIKTRNYAIHFCELSMEAENFSYKKENHVHC